MAVRDLTKWAGIGTQRARCLLEDISTLAECDFSAPLHTQGRGVFTKLRNKLAAMLANMNETLRQMIGFTRMIATTAAYIAERNGELAHRTSEQAASVQATSSSIEALAATVNHSAENAERADRLARNADELAQEGRTVVSQVVTSMESIGVSAKQIEGIVGVINELAFQTNILALNAAVEAARAGEQGRGFAVVAGEVRALATRCSGAAKEIESLIQDSTKAIAGGQSLALDADQKMASIVEGVQEASTLMRKISAAAGEQSLGIQATNKAISNIERITRQNSQLVEDLAQDSEILRVQSGFLADAAKVFKLRDPAAVTHPMHEQMRAIAVRTSSEVGKTLENAVKQGQLTKDELFDRDYQPIPNTDPKKYRTRFDELTDKLLPPIQEPLLEQCPSVVYAGAVDNNGYFPTHNKRFAQPLTGNREVDLAHNRTKRIFEDRVGKICGSHTEPAKLQSYRRDTGELMFDVSAPILVFGEHWGGFRVGYRIE